jgi:hypothetical protein
MLLAAMLLAVMVAAMQSRIGLHSWLETYAESVGVLLQVCQISHKTAQLHSLH